MSPPWLYSNINEIPYLNQDKNDTNQEKYISDLIYATEISYNELYNNLNKTNQETKEYIENREDNNPIVGGEDPLSDSLIQSYNMNNYYLTEKNENEVQYMKQISNRIKNLQNASYNNKLINQILSGNPNTEYDIYSKGEIKNVEDQIRNIHDENELNNKKVQIAEYYEKKRQYQIRYFQRASIILGFLFLCGIIHKMGVMPDLLFIGFIGVGLAILVIYTGYTSIDMYFRDKSDFDEYTFISSDVYLNKGTSNNDSSGSLQEQDDLVSEQCYIDKYTTS